MPFLGRHAELGALRSAFDRSEPTLVVLSGPSGVGKTALVRRALDGIPHLRLPCPPLPDPDIRAELEERIQARIGDGEGDDSDRREGASDLPGWGPLLDRVAAHVAEQSRPWVLVLDDAHRLSQARSRTGKPMKRLLTPRPGPPLHLLVAGRAPGLPEPPETEPHLRLALRPLPFRAALPRLPGRDAVGRIRSYAVFGGTPAHLLHLDPGATLGTNLRRLVLEPGAPLARTGLELLEPTLQTPARYVAILAALARGEADWGEIHAGVRDLTASGQVAPYLKRLEEMGLVQVRRSLDAPPRGRSRRYRIVDPFTAFWFRFLLPSLDRLGGDGARDLLTDSVRPGLEAQVASVFPWICRQFMRNDVMEHLAVNARELGSLWGEGYDIPVAGILSSGVPFYGKASWAERPTVAHLARLDDEVRETRYGFGREVRLRALFSPHRFPRPLERKIASRADGILVGPGMLAGEE